MEGDRLSEVERCPDCGHENVAGSLACAACGFPLRAEALAAAPAVAPTQPPPLASDPAPAPGAPPSLPFRPRRRPTYGSNEALTLWLVFGTVMTLVVLFVAVKSNVDRVRPPVQGATPVQQVNVDSLRQVLERDSTDVQARVRLGDILYDTGNWSEAIVHYRSAIRLDSSQVTALVDLGVCYYNLGESPRAEELFRLALVREPEQPIALFNLGIVHERREDHARAREYYRRALATDPPPGLREAILEAMGRSQQKATP